MYSDKEIELIKATFAENDFLLKAVRKLFFGIGLSEFEKETIIDTFKNKEVVEVLRRKVYGLNNFDTPIGQLSDFWIGAEKQIFGATPEAVKQTIRSKDKVLSMFIQAFELLENPDGEKINIEYNVDEDDELGVGLIARNLYMQAVETALLTIKTIAGQKSETIEETVKRLTQDSAK